MHATLWHRHCSVISFPRNGESSRQRLRFGLTHAGGGNDKEKLQDVVKETNKALVRAGQEVHQQLAKGTIRSTSTVRNEQILWERQEALWVREIQRWDAERTSWDAREAELLGQISKLQDAIIQLATHKNSSGVAQPDLPKQESPSGPNWPFRAEQTDSTSETKGRPPSVLHDAAPYLPGDDSSFQSPAPKDFPPLQAQLPPANSASKELRESLQAAFSAINSGDVLDPNFESLIRRPVGAQSGNGHCQSQPEGGPPTLALGSDDIFWMSQLHGALMQASFYPGEEDIEDWIFGDQTHSALLTYQASMGLPETGIADEATWRRLLGPRYHSIQTPKEVPQDKTVSQADFGSSDSLMNQIDSIMAMRGVSELENRRRNNYVQETSVAGAAEEFNDWPVLREGDGGKAVHHLHVALERKGFIPDEEDQRWWFFGTSTHDCLVTLQACSGLQETGVADAKTWMAILGAKASPATMADLTNEFEDDLTDNSDAVWLIGEQRWERRKRLM